MKEATDLHLNDGVYVGITKDGPRVTIQFRLGGKVQPLIEASAAEAIKAGGDILKHGSSALIPVNFADGDARVFAQRLMEFVADNH